MGLSYDIVSQLAKVVKEDKKQSSGSIVYGTVKTDANGNKYVQFDGSDQLTPLGDDNQPTVESTTANVSENDRVSVLLKNHTATIIGNVSSPAANNNDIETSITKFDIAIGEQIQANRAYFKELIGDNVDVNNLTAAIISVLDLVATEAEIEDLIAGKITVTDLIATKIDADVVISDKAIVDRLQSSNIDVLSLIADKAVIEELIANDADLDSLEAKNAYLKYANIDFSNIGQAAMEYFYAQSGLIKNVTVGNQTITGELVGVTIKGNLIEGGTVVADKLVMKGEDGLYYKLNVDGGATVSEEITEEKLQNGLHGDVIIANTITAEKVNVHDLVAFGATIGGFNITDNSIYSGVKESVDNTTRGIYFDSEGQMAVGDANQYFRYYKVSDGNYKLEISAGSVNIGTSNKTVETVIQEIQQDMDTLRDEVATVLRIDSSRGTVFKNSLVSTVLSAVIYHGTKRITDIDTLKQEYGMGAYLEWSWQRLNEETFGTILATDSRIGDGGFTFTLSPEDVDTKVVFMCSLITD